MRAPKELAERLRNVYTEELTRSLKSPDQRGMHGIQIQVMLHHAYGGNPILYEEPDERT